MNTTPLLWAWRGMTGKIIFLLAILLFIDNLSASAGEPFSASVKKIIDGDSLLLKSGRKTIEVRLYGVDCPEYNQAFAGEAKALARKRVYGNTVMVQPQYYDSYKRLVAIVSYGGQSLNGDLVRAGFAWVYPRYCKKKICSSWKKMESSAKKQKLGLWSSSEVIAPWKWKRMKHGN